MVLIKTKTLGVGHMFILANNFIGFDSKQNDLIFELCVFLVIV